MGQLWRCCLMDFSPIRQNQIGCFHLQWTCRMWKDVNPSRPTNEHKQTSKYLKHLKEWGKTDIFVHTTSYCVNVCEVSPCLFLFHMFLASNLSHVFCAALTVQISKRSAHSGCSCKTLGICEMLTFRNILTFSATFSSLKMNGALHLQTLYAVSKLSPLISAFVQFIIRLATVFSIL